MQLARRTAPLHQVRFGRIVVVTLGPSSQNLPFVTRRQNLPFVTPRMVAGKPTSAQSVLTADRIELAMASEDASLVFMRAFLLAQRSKAPEIRIEHLLAALDLDMPLAVESSIRPEPPFLPVPHQDLPLSPGVAAALGSLGDISHVSLKALRNVLLDAQRRGAT